MKRHWTRRKFLETSLAGPLMLRGAKSSEAGTAARALKQNSLTPAEVETLQTAMDEIIPAGDGMPAVSDVGGVQYLERVARRNRDFRDGLKRSLAELARLSHARFKKGFTRLSRMQCLRVLQEFERGSASDFAGLRDDVYEAYYTQPQVWKLIGYDFYPTNEAGPPMKPFEESVLATVRGKPRHYREVS